MNIKNTFSLRPISPKKDRMIWFVLIFFAFMLTANLGAIIDSIYHPEIEYFDSEHILVGIISAFIVGSMLVLLIVYIERLKKALNDISQGEEKKRQSEDQFQTLLQTAMDGFWMADVNGKILQVNEAYCRMSGYTEQELLTMRITDLESAETADATTAHIQTVISKGEDRFETKHQKKDGTVYDIEVNVQFKNIDGGKFVVFLQGITERKRAEEKLQKSEERIKTIFETLSEGVALNEMVFNSTGEMIDYTILEVNDAFYKIANYRNDEIVVGNRASKLYGMDNELIKEFWKTHKHATSTIVTEYITPTNKKIFRISTSPFINNRFVTSFQEITERKIAENKLKESEEKYRLLYESNQMPIAIFETETLKFLSVNNAFVHKYGYTREEFSTMTILEIRPESEIPRVQHSVKMNDKGLVNLGEYLHKKKNGEIIHVEIIRYDLVFEGKNAKLVFANDITERKHAEEALRESEDKFKHIFEYSIIGKSVTHFNGDIQVNRAFCDMLGYTFEEMQNKKWQEFTHPDDIELTQKYIDSLVSGEKESVRFDKRYIHKSGIIVWVDLSSSIRRDKQYKPLYLMSAMIDITDRKQNDQINVGRLRLITYADAHSTDEILRETLDELENLTNSKIGFYHFLEADQETLTLQNWSSRTLKEMCTAEGKHTHYHISKAGVWADCIRTHGPVIHNDYASLADKKGMPEGHAEVTRELVVPVFRNNKIVAILGVGNKVENYSEKDVAIASKFADMAWEIIERKKTEEELRESEDKYRGVVENSPNAIAIYVEGKIVFVNNQCVLLMGAVNKEELIGKSVIQFVHPDNRAMVIARMQQVAIDGKPLPTAEEKFIRIDGTSVDVEVRAVPTNYKQKPAVQLIVQDITERKNNEQALRQAQKLESIGTLAGGIAHDFNNLMNAVLGQSSIALNKLPKESPAANNIQKAIKAGERVADLTKQLLAYSGRGRFVIDEIDLNKLVKENVAMLEVSIPKTTQLRYELGNPSPHIMGDISQIQQVIMNLIINAGEAMGSNPGFITIHTNRIELPENNSAYSKYSATPIAAGSYAMVQVKDNGSGISEETLARIFDPFFTTKFTGRGLGLAAVLGIIKGHKGGLRIESEVGKGTMFEIIWPLVEASTISNITEKKEIEVNGEGKTILVIDDEFTVIELVNDVLSESNFKVMSALDPIKGIDLYRQHHQTISMVVLDYSMPHMDGKAAFEKLLQINREVKVLLCSGYTEEETMSVFGIDRPTGFFHKPYMPDALLERVGEIVSRDR